MDILGSAPDGSKSGGALRDRLTEPPQGNTGEPPVIHDL